MMMSFDTSRFLLAVMVIFGSVAATTATTQQVASLPRDIIEGKHELATTGNLLRGASEVNDQASTAGKRHLQEVVNTCSLGQQFVLLDFETTGDGTPLNGGDYVGDSEWLTGSYSLIISANTTDGGFTPNDRVRIFNTSNPGTNQLNGDPDLGSPNRFCPGGGPGAGLGGRPGMPGENCIPQGNVLILQETDKPEPDDNIGGGMMCFDFGNMPVDVLSIGVMDMASGRPDHLEVFEAGSSTSSRIGVIGLGNNAAHNVTVNRNNVARICVHIVGEGAVSHIGFCTPSLTIDPAPPLPNDTPWSYELPAWWETVQEVNGSEDLFRCFKRQFPPEEGSTCATRKKVCYWGDQVCDVGHFPTTQCTCDGGRHTPGTWSCQPEVCPGTV